MTAPTTTPQLEAGTWVIDPTHSSIGFSVRHLVVSKIRGAFHAFSGTVTVPADGDASVSAEISIDSLYSGNEQRDAHIKAPDFFDAEHFPTAAFTSTALRQDGEDYFLDGDFTLKGVTKPITLSLAFNGINPGMGRGTVAGFEARAEIRRTDFGIGGDYPLETGGVMVSDKVVVTIDVEALKPA
jgi:polyisoprenoid-binding protein YceI